MAGDSSEERPGSGLLAPAESTSAVERALRGLRRLVLNRSLLPGEQIRQAEMAERLEVSRVPLREALKVLETEGVLLHRPNQGYFVTRLRTEELEQIYLMRRLLESELLRSMAWPDPDQLASIAAHNDDLAAAIGASDVEAMVLANRSFHFGLFDLSSQDLVRREVHRLWALSDPYRAVYLFDPRAQKRVLTEHQAILHALEERSLTDLVAVSDAHRGAVVTHFADVLLGDSPPRSQDQAGPASQAR